MNVDKLLNNSDILINGLKKNGYKKTKIGDVKQVLRFIDKNRDNSWDDYQQAFSDFIKRKKYSDKSVVGFFSIFHQLEDFDQFGIIPDHFAKCRAFKRKSSYDQLNTEFKEFIDFSLEKGRAENLKERTLKVRKSSASCFLLSMMERGRSSLKEITEDDVLSYYLDEEDNLKIASYTANQVRYLFINGKEYDHFEGERVLNLLITIKRRTKNQPVLSDQEVEKIRAVLADKTNGLDYRDRAMVSFLLYTGVRACDVVGLMSGSIDRDAQEISIIQQKTNTPLTIPLIPQLQRALDEYIEYQRPESDLDCIFLSKTVKPHPISYNAIYRAVDHVFDIAEIRMHGERRGAHIFRRYFATKLLGNKVPRPEISKMLGHRAPESIEPYLGTDLENIKKRALSIEGFPIDEEVFKVCEK